MLRTIRSEVLLGIQLIWRLQVNFTGSFNTLLYVIQLCKDREYTRF